MSVSPLPAEALRRRCDPAAFAFETTAALEPLGEPFGQERAAEAIRFGAGMRVDGYHVFALGPPGVGKHRLALALLSARAERETVPSDWCYVHDFGDPQHPRAVELPPGNAARFRDDLEGLVQELRAAVPAAFESEEYRTRLQLLHKQVEEEREKAMADLQKRAEARGIAVVRTPMGLAVAPVKDREVVDPEAFQKLPEEEQARIRVNLAEMQEAIAELVRSFPAQERRHREQVKELNREVALYAVGHLIDELRKRHRDLPAVVAHLDAVQKDVIENVHEFLSSSEGGEEGLAGQVRRLFAETPALRRYQVNVLVDRSGVRGAPVVYEDLPTQPALVGRMEQHAHFGTLVTDFTLLRPGALHRANGGYLVLDARKVLTHPFAWEALKRALRSRQIRIEPPERLYGLSGGASLEPRPIPLDVKVVLLGERMIHALLGALDPDFASLFKVAADFEDDVPRDGGNELRFARLIARVAAEERLRPFDREAVAGLVEQAARLAGDGGRLTVRIEDVVDLMHESNQAADQAGRAAVSAEDVREAVEGQLRRDDRLRRRTREMIAEGTVLIDTAGSVTGQVNGLSVIPVGRFPFGRPSRITARIRLGRGEVVDIEREVELGGPIHSKGVLILAGFLGARFAPDRPLALSASLVFEQSYSGVEGDSASVAELCALLSALGEVPIRQGVAVTGSVNQMGEVQAVGGVNEKVEGFFEVCRERGLDGTQGVILPAANVRHLMLRPDVVEACRAGRFHVWAASHADEALEILTGVPAGARGADGRWPEGSVNARVAARLEALAAAARAFADMGREGPR